jgi:hypothetical protein
LTENAANVRAQIADNPQYQAFKARMAKQAEADVAIANAGPLAAQKAPFDLRETRQGLVYNGLSQPVLNSPIRVDTVDDQGNKHVAFVTPPLPGTTAGTTPSGGGASVSSPASGAPTGIPPGAPSGVPTPPGTGVPTGGQTTTPPTGAPGPMTELGPGQHAALVTRADEEQTQRQKVINDANTAQQSQAGLQNMQNDMGNFKQGPFAAHYQAAATYLRLIDPSWNGQVSGYEDFVKNAGALTRTAVHDTSSRAAAQEYTMINATLPNPEMSENGLRMVTNELMGLNDFKTAKSQAQAQWEQSHGGIGNVSGFETDFQNKVSPYAFIVARMDPADRQQMFGKLQGSPEGQQELSRIGQQLTFMKQSGLAQ